LNIWIVNPFDPLPGESLRPGRYAFLAKLLSDKGHEVTWWTSNFSHMFKSFRQPGAADSDVRTIQLKTPVYKKNICLKRIYNHRVYAGQFMRQAMRQETPADVIVASCPPLSSAMAAIKIAERTGAKCVIDVQDLWPESFEVISSSKIFKALLNPLKKYADKIYRSADALTAVSKTYLERAVSVRGNEGRDFVMPLGIDLSFIEDLEEDSNPLPDKSDGEFWAAYIGTLGSCYDVSTVLRAAEMLKSTHPNIKFMIAGDGPQIGKLKRLAEKNDLFNCIFLGFLGYGNLRRLLNLSDVGLNVFARNAKNSFPNKAFDYMAAGLPMINSITGELEELITKEGIGIQYRPGDAASLRDAVLRLYNDRAGREMMARGAKKLARQRYDRNKEYPKYEEFLQDVAYGTAGN
jgi:glycosyltransferase involved in cell wall biosynthesis